MDNAYALPCAVCGRDIMCNLPWYPIVICTACDPDSPAGILARATAYGFHRPELATLADVEQAELDRMY